jgi:hypothetical protein
MWGRIERLNKSLASEEASYNNRGKRFAHCRSGKTWPLL